MALRFDEIQLANTSSHIYPYLDGDSGTYVRMSSANGNVRIGCGNTSYCHFFTDRGLYFFDRSIVVGGNILDSYSGDLQLRRMQSNADKIQIKNTEIDFHIDSGIRVRFQNSGNIHADGDVIAYSTTISDKRLKDEVETIPNALDKIKSLRGVSYVWNNGSRKGKKDLGVIAQEVEGVLPEIVHEHEMPLMDDSGKKYKTVDYEKMVGVLIEAIKEQQQQIDELKKLIK